MKRTFLTGLAILLPIAVTFFIVAFVVDFLTDPFVGLIEDFITKQETTELAAHKTLLLIVSRLIVLILFFVLVLILGFLGRKFFFSWLVNLTHRIMEKIPIIKTIYRITREISTNIFSEKKKNLFKGTVQVPFPHEKSKALGLLSGSPPGEVEQKKGGLQTVFVPTSPHPISGFLMMYDEKEIAQTEIPTEDLFKFLLSCGAYHPGETKK
ncbi:MAG: DUF502 domain-containing protein [Chlamydiia bacterium]|nr:DUF502 domain-containing protein [Chlamydiia bacterium]